MYVLFCILLAFPELQWALKSAPKYLQTAVDSYYACIAPAPTVDNLTQFWGFGKMQMVATTIRRPAPSFVKRFTKYPPFLSSIINLHSRSPFMIPLPLVDDLLRTSLIHCDHNTGMKTSLSNIYMSFHCEFTILKFCDSGPNITTTKNLYLRRWKPMKLPV